MSDYLAIGWEEFCFTIPEWWMPIDLSGDIPVQVDALLASQFAGRPAELDRAIELGRDQLIASFEEAHKAGVHLVLAESRPMFGEPDEPVLTGAQVLVSRMAVPEKTTGLNHLLPEMVSNPDGRLRNLGGMAVFRHETTSDGTEEAKLMYKKAGGALHNTAPVAKHLVRYLVGPVEMGKPWAAMAISINEGVMAPEVARPLLNLVDSIALTVRTL